MSKQTPLTVYWCPTWDHYATSNNWNMLYADPTTLHKELMSVRNKDNSRGYFACPAVTNDTKNTLVFKSPMDMHYSYTTDSEGKVSFEFKSKTWLGIEQHRPYTTLIGPTLRMAYQITLFSEEPLVAKFTSPYFHEPKYTKYGALIPGSFDVGQWFRPFNAEIQTWSPNGEIIIEKDEPLLYVELQTDRHIDLKRANFSDELSKHVFSCTQDPFYVEANVPLVNRYRRFKESRQREIVLKELKKNLI